MELSNTLGKPERLKSPIAIGELFSSGFVITTPTFKVFWNFSDDDDQVYPARVAIIVSKKKFRNAVDRNLIKRRMREAYRTRKYILYEFLSKHNRKVNLLLVYLPNESYNYATIQNKFEGTLQLLINKIEACL